VAGIDLRSKGDRADRTFRWLAIGAAALVLLVLGLIALTMSTRSTAVLEKMGLGFFTSDRWVANDNDPSQALYGALPFIWGTLYTATIAVILAVPISLGIALFITQVAPAKLRRPLVYFVDLLAVVPSVVYGLWGVLVLAPKIKGVYDSIHNAVDGIPVLQSIFGSASAGKSFMTAGVILAIMIIPIITSLAREVIETTPPGEKEAALALGATRWEMIRTSVLPHSRVGLVGAVMLGLGRAMGETIAATLVIGGSAAVTTNLFGSGNSMPAIIASEWGEAGDLHKSALIALAMTLFLITIAVNLIATRIVGAKRIA